MRFRIKEICKEKGILMETLAGILSIHPNSLTRNINGNPTIETLEKIADALNVPVVELFQCPQAAHQSGHIACPYCGAVIELSAGKTSGSNP